MLLLAKEGAVKRTVILLLTLHSITRAAKGIENRRYAHLTQKEEVPGAMEWVHYGDASYTIAGSNDTVHVSMTC